MSTEQVRVDPINRDFSEPAERVRLMACRLIGNYPAKEYHHQYGVDLAQMEIASANMGKEDISTTTSSLQNSDLTDRADQGNGTECIFQ